MDKIRKLYDKIQKETKHGKIRRVLATSMAGIVVFSTTYSLILPAITADYDTAANIPGMDFIIDEEQHNPGNSGSAAVGSAAEPVNEAADPVGRDHLPRCGRRLLPRRCVPVEEIQIGRAHV